MTETSSSQATASPVQAGSAPDLSRVFRSAVAEILVASGVDKLNPQAIGSCIVLLKQLCDSHQDTGCMQILVSKAKATLLMRGTPAAEIDLSLTALEMVGLIRLHNEAVSFPLLEQAYAKESETLGRRKAGWDKRLGKAVDAPQSAGVAGRVQTEVKPKAQKLKPNSNVRRFTAQDSAFTSEDDDPVALRVACKDGKTAEITQGYVAHLKAHFPELDVEVALRAMALWCESNPKKTKTFGGFRRFVNFWLTNQERDRSMRTALLRTGNQRNGFGQGESAPQSALTGVQAEQSSARASVGLDNEFDDLFSQSEPSAAATPKPVEPEVGATPNPLTAGQSIVHKARGGLRRLSMVPHSTSRIVGTGFRRLSQ